MGENERVIKLASLFENWNGNKPSALSALPPSGSYREYYRLSDVNSSAIGVYNPDVKENRAFIEFSKHFFSKGLNVPEVFCEDEDGLHYLISDLGNTTLFNFISDYRKGTEFPLILIDTYKRIIDEMPLFQVVAGKTLDYSFCYPRAGFDKQSMLWDLSYFKYYFLKLAKIPFDEQKLEDDFQTFSDFLLQAESDYFLYRDFQSRNIMLCGEVPFFIDYQGGRKGALQYDLASLLYDAKADIPQNIREELLDYYINTIGKFIPVDRKIFTDYFYGFVLIRILQAMGAYGFRGFYEKREHFLKSIPYALTNLAWLLKNNRLPVKIDSLERVLNSMINSEELKKFGEKINSNNNLTVTISSFSFRKGIPEDTNGNGGGFVFDCRALHNPGLYNELKGKTGLDVEISEFFRRENEAGEFIKMVMQTVGFSVERYMLKGYSNLAVNFGCTGGRHRSVWCAENLARLLAEKYSVKIVIRHTEI